MNEELNNIKMSFDPTQSDDVVSIHRVRVRIPLLSKKRHSSRKWKKKRGLLKRQRKAALKRFHKTVHKIAKAVREAAKSCCRLGEIIPDVSRFFEDVDWGKGE